MFSELNDESIITYTRADFDALLGVSEAKVDMFIEGVMNAKPIPISNPNPKRGRPRKDSIWYKCPFCEQHLLFPKSLVEYEDVMHYLVHTNECPWEMAFEIIEKIPAY
jgi:hypothetical protein